jgi:hypothetical protein
VLGLRRVGVAALRFPVLGFPVAVPERLLRRRPGMDLPFVLGTVGGATDATSGGIAG